MSKGDIHIFLSTLRAPPPAILMGIQGGEPPTLTPSALKQVRGGIQWDPDSLELERGTLESEPTVPLDGWEATTSTSLLTALSPEAFYPSKITSTYCLAKQTPLLTLRSPSSHHRAVLFIAMPCASSSVSALVQYSLDSSPITLPGFARLLGITLLDSAHSALLPGFSSPYVTFPWHYPLLFQYSAVTSEKRPVVFPVWIKCQSLVPPCYFLENLYNSIY